MLKKTTKPLALILALILVISATLIPTSIIASAATEDIDYSLFTGRHTWKFDTDAANENFQINMLNAVVDKNNGYFSAPTNWAQTQPVNYEFIAGKTYVVNFKWKLSAKPTDGFQFQLRVNDTAFKNYGWMSSVPTDWQTDRIQFTAGNTGLLKIYMNAGTGETLYIDTISIYEVGSSVRFDFSDDTQLMVRYYSSNFTYTTDETLSANVTKQWSTDFQFVPDYVIENGKKYTVTFKYKANTALTGNKFVVSYHKGTAGWNYYDNENGFVTPSLNTAAANTWYTGEFTFVANNGADYPYLDFLLRPTKAATYEFDDITINEVEIPNVGTVILDTGDGKTEEANLGELLGGDTFLLPTLSRVGYEFVSWHTNSELTNPIDSVKVPNKGESVTVYAEWKIQEFYNLDFSESTDLEVGASWFGGSGCNPEIKELDGNKVLSVKGSKNTSASTARLPISLKPGVYTYSFKYRANPANAGDQYSLSFIASNNEATDNTTLAAGKVIGSIISWQALSTDNDFVEKSGNITVTEEMLANNANKLTLLFKTSQESDMLYIDDFVFSLSSPVTVSFDVDGGDKIEDVLTASGSKIVLPNTLKGGKTFDGWYDSPALTNKVGDIGDEYVVPSGSDTVTLYAKWGDECEWNFTFENKKDLDVGASWFAGYAPTIADDNGNGALLIKGNKDTANCVARLPLALSSNTTYTYSFDYKTIPVEAGDSYSVSLAIVDNKSKDNTELSNGKRISTVFSFAVIDTGNEYKNAFGTFTVAEDMISSNANRLAIFIKTSRKDAVMYIDNFNIKKSTNPTYTESKTYDFDDATGILSPIAGSTLSNGALEIECGWGKYMSLDYILKDNQAYNITMYYKVALKEGQQYQSFKLLYDYGTASSHDYLTQNIGTSGWVSGTSQEYIGLKSSFTVKTTGIEDGKCFLWLGIDGDPGTAEDAAIKGGGKIIIDKIVISEKKDVVYVPEKEFKFDDINEVLSLPSGSNMKNGELIHKANWSQWLGLEYIVKNNQQYEITIKYKVKFANGQKSQSMNFAVGYGSESKSEKTISSFGWSTLKNTEYDTFVSRFTVTANMVSEGCNYLWLYLNGDPGTAKDAANKGGGTLYIDSIVVKEKAETPYLANKEFKFDDKSEILALPAGSTVKDGNIVNTCGWGLWLGLEYLIKNNQQYEITIRYKVKLANGQKYQSMNFGVAHGSESKSENMISSFGWQTLKNTEYDTFVSRFTVNADTVSDGSDYLWLFLNGDPDISKGTGGGTLYIDSIVVKEKEPLKPEKKKTWTFDDKSDLLSIPSLATIKDGALVDKCGWGQNLGFAYMFEPERTYQITIKYKVDTPNQQLHLVLYSGSMTAPKKVMGTIINWKRASNTSYTTLTYEVDTNAEMFVDGNNLMWIYLNNDPELGGTLYIDEITVENMGPLDYRLYGNAIESYEWKAYEEDTEYSDWKQWELKAAPSNNADSFNADIKSINVWVYIIIGSAVLLLAGVTTSFVIIRKKKSK